MKSFKTLEQALFEELVKKESKLSEELMKLREDPLFSSYVYELYGMSIDKDGKVTQVEYQPYSLGYTTSVGKGKSGSISVSIDNNVEMKIKDKNDSIKKVSLKDSNERSGYYEGTL